MTGLIMGGLIVLAAMLATALARPVAVPLAIVGLGGAILAFMGYSMNTSPCTGDAAGCGMSSGFEALILMSVAAPLVCGALAAVLWRLVAGREAGLGTRLLSIVVSAVLLTLVGLLFL
ncbi:hypothetical protein [Oceanicola sp. 502str15]|uniref:hypothetical protein n=1 Tax=Oceanicola sp. 502str15 TaxID=2696061 RepID=UPI002094A0C0|nr:hypothetical protein [Oceanicola sp. 502str15]MCO6385133.1 hypothetical protein [Oceanicola sp. 502str15]